MKIRLPRNLMFPLAVAAFIGVTIKYTNVIFTSSTRWGFLAVLALYLLIKNRMMYGFHSRFGLALLIYCTWCLLTSAWSIVPELSIAKSAAMILVALSFVSAGYWWPFDKGSLNAMNYLIPVTAMGILAGVSGGASSEVFGQGRVALYQGALTSNPNMLGSLAAMSIPLLLWNAYRHRTKLKMIWIALLVIDIAVLMRTHARSSILCAGVIGIGLCLSLKLRKTGFVLVLMAAALLLVVASTDSAFLDSTYSDYVLKGATQKNGAVFSRQQVWAQSYENAEQGGWFGVGYGATVGDTEFEGGLSSLGYGREKGNSQLAIVEETGLVGLGLYAILLITLFTRLISAHLRERSRDNKVILGLVTGALAGLTLQSVFEAWWVAPGSAESVYFWSLAGVGLGIARSSLYSPKAEVPRSKTLELAVYPERLPQPDGVEG
jgi:O-antigen ligase